jgi:SAM-dependent methyltransferase
VTRHLLGLRSSTGDAPGNLREIVTRVSSAGTVRHVSDIHHMRRPTGTGVDTFVQAIVVESERAAADVAAGVRDLVAQTASRMPASAQFSVDVDALYPLGGANTLVHPLVLAALDSLADQPAFPKSVVVHELLRALPDKVRQRIFRLPGTAELAAVRALDYDAIGDARANYHNVRPLSRFNVEVFDLVRDAIDAHQGSRVMDIGCGTGRFSRLLADTGAQVVGVDKSANMLAVARDEPGAASAGVAYVCADANDTLPHGPFDAITFFFSVQYMQLQRAFWRRLVGSLKGGGTVAIASFPHTHFAQTEHARFFPLIASIDMARFPSIPRLCALLQAYGFESVTVRYAVWREATPAQTLIRRTEARYLSTFHLLPQLEFERGLAAMRAANAAALTVERTIRAVVVSARLRDCTT